MNLHEYQAKRLFADYGIPVQSAVLAPGDQFAIDQHRFVLEAPGLPSRGQTASVRPVSVSHTQTIKAVQARVSDVDVDHGSATGTPSTPPNPRRSSSALWWLIAVATILAAALTALLIYAPRLAGG